MIKITFEGAGQVKNLGTKIRQVIEAHNKSELSKLAIQGEATIRKRIVVQSFSFSSLSPEYLKQKQSKGQGSKMFIATGKYLSSIRSRLVNDKESWTFIDPSTQGEGGISYTDIAKILEFGSKARNLPARPLWGTTMKILKKSTEEKRWNMNELASKLKQIR